MTAPRVGAVVRGVLAGAVRGIMARCQAELVSGSACRMSSVAHCAVTTGGCPTRCSTMAAEVVLPLHPPKSAALPAAIRVNPDSTNARMGKILVLRIIRALAYPV